MDLIEQLRSEIDYVEAHLLAIHARADEPVDGDDTAWDEGRTWLYGADGTRDEPAEGSARARLVDLEARAAIAAQVSAGHGQHADIPAIHTRTNVTDDVNDVDLRTASRGEVRDLAMRSIEQADRTIYQHLDDQRADAMERLLSRGTTQDFDPDLVARQLVATERSAYQEAFILGLNGREAEWTPEQRSAVAEYRALSIGTPSAGGYAIPVVIDPTVVITDGRALNPLIDLARVEPITTDKWRGVSGAQTVWSMVAEGDESTDDSSTFAQPEVEAKQARAFIPYSYEIGMDWPGFANEMGRLLMSGYTTLVANQLAVGDGSGNNTTGIFTAATTTVEVATFNAFVGGDIDAVYAATPELFRARGAWTMNVDIENRIRAFSEGSEGSRFTVNQTAEGIGILNGKQIALTDSAPVWTPSASQDVLVFGDFEHFVVAQRIGMQLEAIPQLFGANQRPTGQRGLIGWARFGSGVSAVNAFRKLVNKAA